MRMAQAFQLVFAAPTCFEGGGGQHPRKPAAHPKNVTAACTLLEWLVGLQSPIT